MKTKFQNKAESQAEGQWEVTECEPLLQGQGKPRGRGNISQGRLRQAGSLVHLLSGLEGETEQGGEGAESRRDHHFMTPMAEMFTGWPRSG